MPETKVVFSQGTDGAIPVVDWFTKLRKVDPNGWANCRARITQLAVMGHELRRPAADYLRERKSYFEKNPNTHTYTVGDHDE